MLVRNVLRSISNDRRLEDRAPGATPLNNLIDTYNKRAAVDDSLTPMHANSTGKDLKAAINKMRAEDQVSLLFLYISAAKEALEDNSVHSEERHLRHWIIKVLIIGFAISACVLIGAVVVVGVRSGVLADGAIVSSIMTTATEILKVVFATH